jgi:DNA repair protein RadC
MNPDTNMQSLFKVTEVELIYHNKTKVADRPKVVTSRQAHDILKHTWDLNRIELVEQFRIMLLDRRNAVIGLSTVSTGGISGCVVDPKIIFATALKARASGIILAHNHPSGNLTASQADIDLTRKMSLGAKYLEMQVLDHLIVTREGYYSFADEGLMPS